MTKADFALQWLDYLGNEIYHNGKRILVPDRTDHFFPDYEISKLNTRIKVGEKLGEEEDDAEYTIMPYLELINLGYTITVGTDFIWKPRQRCYYKISPKNRDIMGITSDSFQKSGCQLQHDAVNRRFRLRGENVLADAKLRVDSGIGKWVVYDADRPIISHYKKREVNFTKEGYRAMLKGRMFGDSVQDAEYLYIKDVPVIISDEKYIVCIKKDIVTKRFIVVGQTRKGKSTMVNSLAGRIFYMWEDRVGWLIDPMNQFEDLSLPQDFNDFIKINAMIGNEPRPIPAIQFYLACKHKINIKHNNISFLLTLNFLEFLRKYSFYTYGIDSYVLKGTTRYFEDAIPYIKDATTAKEMEEGIFRAIPGGKDNKNLAGMVHKWTATFKTLFREKFTSNQYKGNDKAIDEMEVRFKDGTTMKDHPFIVAYEAGLVPVMNISAAKDTRWVRNYLADLMQKIVSHQMGMPERMKKRVWIVADELNEIYEIGKKKDVASEVFEGMYRQGGFNNIGFIGNTQSLDKLNPEMYKNAEYICCCYMQDHKERKRVGDTFNLSKETYNQIESLKTQEMMIFSKDPWVIIDRWGRRKVVTDRKWFKGRIIPPLNYHKIPPGG